MKLEMVGCPSGKFWMGQGHDSPIAKEHIVEITRPFWFGKYPVTVEQWERLMPRAEPPPGVQRSDIDPKLPIQVFANGTMGLTGVSAEELMTKLTRMFERQLPRGYVFRFPTEAEWEYALKANSTIPNDPFVNPNGISKQAKAETYVLGTESKDYWIPRGIEPRLYERTEWFIGPYIPVGRKKPNAWGIYDMGGITSEPMLDSWVTTHDEWFAESVPWKRLCVVRARYPQVVEDGVRDPLLFETDKTNAIRLRWARQGFSDSLRNDDPKDSPAHSRHYLYYWFDVGNKQKGAGFATKAVMLRLVVGPDLLKERGITPPKPDADGRDTRPPSVNGKDVRSPSAGVSPDTSKRAQGVSDALYCVVDLSAGPNAEKYPVSYLNAEPKGGWTEEYKTCKLVLRRIEPGSFKMGGRYDVTLTKSFYIGVFEVTQKQYKLVTGDNPSEFKGEIRPVEKVSYDMIRGNDAGAKWPASSAVDSDSFMGKLRTRTGLDSFDLPTEAQWEYACRAGTTSKYNNGGDSDDDLKKLGRFVLNQKLRGHKEPDANFAQHEPDGKGGCLEGHTVVGSYMPNAWGLYDMHGNVWERCLDWRGDLSGGATDPVGSSSGAYRVLRGGSWYNYAHYCTSSSREVKNPSNGYSRRDGFRIAISSDLLMKHGITSAIPKGNGRDAPSQDVSPQTSARSIEVFPHAGAQNAKWKKRAPWRYTMKVPPANWMEPGFRDGMWKRTNKPLGFGKDASFMRIAEKWNTSDVWLRRHFTWKKTEKVTDVVFDMLHDEDVEIYLNGTRILEEKGANTGWGAFSVPVKTFMSAVKEGDNVLAVKVHDGAAPRCFDCGLTVEVENDSINRKENK